MVALCPPGFVTVTPTAPAACAGVVVVIVVVSTTVTPVAALPPTLTVAPVTNPVPRIVRLVPPLVGPDAGVTLVTVGGGPVTVRLNAVVCVTEAAAAVTVIVDVPSAADASAVSVRVVLHVGGHVGVVNDAVTPAGRPAALKVTASLVPDESVAVTVFVTAAPPRTTDLLPPLLTAKSNTGGAVAPTATTSAPSMPHQSAGTAYPIV